MAKRDEILFIT